MSLAEVAAASSGESEVAQLFAAAFDLPSVDLEDDFFQLGGDSLIGESLMTAIERRFGVTLWLSILLEAATPRTLAREVLNYNKARLHRYMLRVRPKGEVPPILCVHGTGGESTALKPSPALPATGSSSPSGRSDWNKANRSRRRSREWPRLI